MSQTCLLSSTLNWLCGSRRLGHRVYSLKEFVALGYPALEDLEAGGNKVSCLHLFKCDILALQVAQEYWYHTFDFDIPRPTAGDEKRMEGFLCTVYLDRRFAKTDIDLLDEDDEDPLDEMEKARLLMMKSMGSADDIGANLLGTMFGSLTAAQELLKQDIPAHILVPGMEPVPCVPALFGLMFDEEGVQAALATMNPLAGDKLKNPKDIRGRIAICQNSKDLAAQAKLAAKFGAKALIVGQKGDEFPVILTECNPLRIPCVLITEKDASLLYQVCQFYDSDGPVTAQISMKPGSGDTGPLSASLYSPCQV